MSANGEAQFYDSVKRRAELKEKAFEIDSTYISHYEAVINRKVWQIFCKRPKAEAMTIVREFYINAFEAQDATVMVRQKQITFNMAAINQLLKIQNAP